MSKINKKNNPTNADSKPKRRWFNIGPGLVLALALSAFIGSQWIKTETAKRQQPSTPPIIERQVISSSYDEKSGPTPEIKFIVDRAAKLRLTNNQLRRLEALQSDWQKFYGPKIAAANQAAAKTDKYMTDEENKSRIPIAHIQSAAAPVIALSGEISSARRNYWNKATKILTSKQSALIQKEREYDWKAKMESLSKKIKAN